MEEAEWKSLWSSAWDYSGGRFSLSGQCCCYLLLENVIRNYVLAGFSQAPGQFVQSQHWWTPGESWGLSPAWCHKCQCHSQTAGVPRVLLCSGLGQLNWENQNLTFIEWECFWWNNSQNFQLAILLDWWSTHVCNWISEKAKILNFRMQAVAVWISSSDGRVLSHWSRTQETWNAFFSPVHHNNDALWSVWLIFGIFT